MADLLGFDEDADLLRINLGTQDLAAQVQDYVNGLIENDNNGNTEGNNNRPQDTPQNAERFRAHEIPQNDPAEINHRYPYDVAVENAEIALQSMTPVEKQAIYHVLQQHLQRQ